MIRVISVIFQICAICLLLHGRVFYGLCVNYDLCLNYNSYLKIRV